MADTITVNDVLALPFAGRIATFPGYYVQFVNNVTSTAYVSGATDINGNFQVTCPVGLYTVSTGTTPAGPWTPTGNTAYPGTEPFDNSLVMHLAGDETATGVKNLQTLYTQGPEVSADSIAFGTPGTDAAVQAALATIKAAGGGVLKFSPNRTYSISAIQMFSNLHVIAHGATIQHTGTGVMIQWGQNDTGVNHATWVGGKLVAAQVVGQTTDMVLAQNTSYSLIDPAEYQGGNADSSICYATNGLHVLGRKWPNPGGVYYNQFGGVKPVLIHGFTGATVWVDGYDPVNSPVQGNFVNGNVYSNLLSQLSGTGPRLDGCQDETFIGGDSEGNIGVGLVMGPHPYYNRFLGMWVEHNNVPNAEQMSVDTTTDAAAQQTNIFVGNCAVTSFRPYWRLFDTFDSREHGGAQNFNANTSRWPIFKQTALNNPVVDFSVLGDAQPQFRVNITPTGGTLKFGPGGVTLPDATFGRTAAATLGTTSTTVLQPAGPFLLPVAGTGGASAGGGANAIWQGALGATLPASTIGQNGAVIINTSNPGGYAIAYKAGGAWFWANGTVYTPSLAPTAVAANTTAEQTFTVTGLTVGQTVVVNGPSPTAGTGVVAHRVSAANTLAITFLNATSGSLTPAAGTYTVRAT